MKEIKNKDKKSFLKNIFIKICRFLGFEIIDQSKAYIPTMGISINENTNILGKKSINLPLGLGKPIPPTPPPVGIFPLNNSIIPFVNLLITPITLLSSG